MQGQSSGDMATLMSSCQACQYSADGHEKDHDDLYHLFFPFIRMESNEETPLLSSATNLDHEEVYKRFAPARKRVILAIVSLIGLIPRTYIKHIWSWVCKYWANG